MHPRAGLHTRRKDGRRSSFGATAGYPTSRDAPGVPLGGSESPAPALLGSRTTKLGLSLMERQIFQVATWIAGLSGTGERAWPAVSVKRATYAAVGLSRIRTLPLMSPCKTAEPEATVTRSSAASISFILANARRYGRAVALA